MANSSSAENRRVDCEMKRIDLIHTKEKKGCVLIRHGSNYDWYQNTNSKMAHPIPRHREIKESLARHIIKMLSE
jgi:mRNA interferase HicA